MQRESGILLHITSLGGPYGIGSLGKRSYEFVDFLHGSKQSYWQMLPLCPTGYGDSPYQSISTHAGNTYLIDIDILAEQGLITRAEAKAAEYNGDPTYVDYSFLWETRGLILEKAYNRGYESVKDSPEYREFLECNDYWIDDYGLFAALKESCGGLWWQSFPKAAALRQARALEDIRGKLSERICYHQYVQYLFFKQWTALKEYASGRGIRIIGDMPMYVASDSADVWAHRELFKLREDGCPRLVAGVPPDYFSDRGQLWGNPVYDWPKHKESGYEWWLKRIESAFKLCDVLRIDHFRGFCDYWEIPYGAEDARPGAWAFGPGAYLMEAVRGRFARAEFIAEDLGLLSARARRFVENAGFPGMKVLQFSFGGRPGKQAPHTYPENSVCYTGTHDNDTISSWLLNAPERDVAMATRYFGLNSHEGPALGMIRGGMASPSRIFIAPMQDWLGLGSESRINTPSTVGLNWRWRLKDGQLTKKLSHDIAQMTTLYGRERKRHGKF